MIQCKLASMRPEYQEELMDIYGEDLDLVQVRQRPSNCDVCTEIQPAQPVLDSHLSLDVCQFKLDSQTFAILVSESGGQVSHALFAV